MKIVVVDDEPGILNLLQEVLELDGPKGVTAADAREALTVCGGTTRPDRVLLDLTLPGRRGIDWAQDLRDLGLRPDSLVMMTGGCEIAPRDYACLPKPFLLDDLRRVVRAGGEPLVSLP